MYHMHIYIHMYIHNIILCVYIVQAVTPLPCACTVPHSAVIMCQHTPAIHETINTYGYCILQKIVHDHNVLGSGCWEASYNDIHYHCEFHITLPSFSQNNFEILQGLTKQHCVNTCSTCRPT